MGGPVAAPVVAVEVLVEELQDVGAVVALEEPVAVEVQLEVDPESRASMYQDLERRRKTEVDVLNGEIVRLAAACGVEAPLNRRIVARVHEAEDAAKGCPRLDADALLAVLLC